MKVMHIENFGNVPLVRFSSANAPLRRMFENVSSFNAMFAGAWRA
jgi:hypothetical protein